jgi:hypothetical protein
MTTMQVCLRMRTLLNEFEAEFENDFRVWNLGTDGAIDEKKPDLKNLLIQRILKTSSVALVFSASAEGVIFLSFDFFHG